MATIPAPTLVLPREEWPDADFDLPEGETIHTPSDKDIDDEDWDIEMNFGSTEGAKAQSGVAAMVARFESSSSKSKPHSCSQTFTIRPPVSLPDIDDEDDDDEGVSTIKVAALPTSIPKKPQSPIDEDFEDAFALPSDLTQLSLAPLSLKSRSSKNSLEWGDKDQTSSSQSSDAYSSLGFADASPSSNSASSLSCPETETEDDEDDDDLEGLVLPPAMFESGQSARKLTKILEMKKKAQLTSNQVKVATPDPEDDFEIGLVIDDDVDLSPSRLLSKAQQQSQRPFNRSSSMPAQRPSSSLLHPPSRANRAKSPLNPPTSSARQLQKIRLSPSPPLRPPARSQTFQALSSAPAAPPSPMSFLSPKPGSLRGQKSYSGLKPPTPPSTLRTLSRKASLSSLIESSHIQASGSGSAVVAGGSKTARYEEPTAASRAKSHKYSTSRAQEFKVPPTRPCTPSSNPAALRLTMPTQSRLKARPALSAVFGGPSAPSAPSPVARATSPLPPRPPSNTSIRSMRALINPQPAAPKVLRRPKRQRTYGDGTELDGIEDLPTDREKEGRYRVQPKSYGNRIPGASFPAKPNEKGNVRKKGRREGSSGSTEASALTAFAPSTNILKRTTTRIEFPSKPSSPSGKKKKPISCPSSHTRRKPTLIRNLGGTNGPKVVGDMKWNPLTLRWEGNDQILRDFDSAVGTSTRPALITHLTGSSIGSPVGSFASGARIVGTMIFDPTRMCWISTLPPDEDEPDVFANLADDEEDGDAWETKGGTIRASLQQPLGSDISSTNTCTTGTSADSSTSSTHAEAPSPARSHTRTTSESGSDRGSRASMVFEIDETFLESCRLAEERHHAEMKGWKAVLSTQDVFSAPDRSGLFEIRALATRKY
ncbi:Protein byr4 [Hypsizygus marmoreus]|uniref:Protein byr4 n=1 Tax=Hypsizygus marmoreus TaxID=39966 RepID=A0A369KBK9_HYPMA|nr:Protein byr4 [Hypsizygus marmoreus]